jgi:hypothetical protein
VWTNFCREREEKKKLMDMLFYWAQPCNPFVLKTSPTTSWTLVKAEKLDHLIHLIHTIGIYVL